MRFINKFRDISLAVLFFLAVSCFSVKPVFAETDQTINDKIIKQLESSGALDRAVEKSLERIKLKEIAAQKAEEEKRHLSQIKQAANLRPVDPSRDFIFGEPAAVVSIIEFSDFECPYCKAFFETPKKVVNDMPKQVNLVWRNFPLDFHNPVATEEAVGAVCASKQGGNSIFWKFAGSIFNNTKLNGKGVGEKEGSAALIQLASKEGLNIKDFKTCISSEAPRKMVQADIEDGKKAGINGTPGVILINHKNGKMDVLAGAVSVETLKEAINKLMR
jgi:protein-disulfide isomerase